jgi:hypothetical protein
VFGAATLEVAGGGGAELEVDTGGGGVELEMGAGRGVEETTATVVDGGEEVVEIGEDAAANVDKTGVVLVRGALVEIAIASGVLVAMTGLSIEVDGADTSTTLVVGATGAAPAVTQMVFTTTWVCVTMSQSVT